MLRLRIQQVVGDLVEVVEDQAVVQVVVQVEVPVEVPVVVDHQTH
jgi:hypothetical protein